MEDPNRSVLVVDLAAAPARSETGSEREIDDSDTLSALLGPESPGVETVTSVAAAIDVIAARGAERDATPHAEVSVEASPVEIVIVRPPANADGFAVIDPVEKVIESCVQFDPSLSVVVVAPSLPAETVAALFDAGVADYVPSEIPAVANLLRHRLDTLTAERRARRLREVARARLPSVLDTVSEAVFAVNPDWHIVYCNRSAESLLGSSAEEVLGKRLFETVERFTEGAAGDRLRRSMEDDESASFEVSVGSVWYDVRTYPSAGGLTVFAQDVTERIEREQLFRGVFESAMDAMVVADDEGTYVDANPAAVELFGAADESDLLGRSIREFAPEGYDFAAAWEHFRKSDAERGVFPLVGLRGRRRVVEFAATPNIVPGRHLSVLRDVTDHPGFPTFAELVDDADSTTDDSATDDPPTEDR